ncbi:MAG: hypothetical protein KBH93_00805 [Anaerolineae bacterium]|nr:hypothetical protein [Anaerolineae bacterium]
MNDFSDERPSLRQRLPTLIPLALIAVIALGNGAFGLLLIWPGWQDHNQMQTQVAGQELALTATVQAIEGAADVLQRQVDNAESRLAEAASIFLSAAQADRMLDLLYRYAQNAGVEILKLQLEAADETAHAGAFNAGTFQVEVNGEPRHLLNFIVQIKEASVPSVVLSEVSISREEDQTRLRMKLTLYTSPYASGSVLDGLTQQRLITPTAPSPTPFRIEPTATPLPTLTPTPLVLASPTPTVTLPSPTPPVSVMGPGAYNDDSPLLQYTQGNWIQIVSVRGTDSSYRYCADAGAEVTFAFEGTAASVQYVSFRNFGIFEVYVDGVYWTAVDSYAQAGTFGQEVTISGLPYGLHVVTVRNTGRHNPASEGTVIALDAVHIQPAIPPSATPALPTLGGN